MKNASHPIPTPYASANLDCGSLRSIAGAAGISVMLALAGCASGSGSTGTSLGSGGSGSGTAGLAGAGSGGSSSSSSVTPFGQVAARTGNVVSATGDSVSNVGGTIGALPIAGVTGTQTRSDLATVVSDAGNVISTAGDGVANGLGAAGSIANPVGATVSNTGNVIQATGQTVQHSGALVSNLGATRLSALAPITTPVGALVGNTGEAISNLGQPLADGLSSGPVERITQTASNAIVPLTSRAATLTQTIGDATGIGAPANNLLARTGGAVARGGQRLGNSGLPLLDDFGNVVIATGNTVSVAGVLLTRQPAGSGSPFNGLLGGINMLNFSNGSAAPVTPLLASLIGTPAGGNGGIGAAGSVKLLTPVLNTAAGLTAGVTGGSTAGGPGLAVATLIGGNAGTPNSGANLLAPVGNLVNALVGNNQR